MAGNTADRRAPTRRIKRFLVAAAAAAPLLAAAPLSAQWFGDPVVPPKAIARILMDRGYSGFSPPRLVGDVYIVQAIDEDGARVRVVLDAYDGRILRPVRGEEFARPAPRVRPRDERFLPDFDDDDDDNEERETRSRFRPHYDREALLPPRSIPGDERQERGAPYLI